MTDVLLCQISRGVAPVKPIIAAVEKAHQFDWVYHAIIGRPLVEAKNEAVRLALESQAALMLVEDDICASDDVWNSAATLTDNAVGYGRANVRGGQENVYVSDDGAFRYAGNCFCVIPLDVLQRLPRPAFSAQRWLKDTDELGGALNNGIGSDTVFWYHVRHLDPQPAIIELGTVEHLKHPLNLVRDNLTPCEITTW